MILQKLGLALLTSFLMFPAFADSLTDYLTPETIEIELISENEIPATLFDREVIYRDEFLNRNKRNSRNKNNKNNVIEMGKDIAALGEEIYQLIDRGRPSIVTSYEPISVVPAIRGEPADPFDMQDWVGDKEKTYKIVVKNLFGMAVVDFTYSLIFRYGGKYQDRGAFITNAQVIPLEVITLMGYDFMANMKLGGIANLGTTEDILVSVNLIFEYSIKTILKASTRAKVFNLDGNGNIKIISN